MRALQQIGLRHPRIRQVRHIASGAGQGRQLLVAEGLWAHRVLVGLDAAVEMFLWCPEAAYSAEAQSLGTGSRRGRAAPTASRPWSLTGSASGSARTACCRWCGCPPGTPTGSS